MKKLSLLLCAVVCVASSAFEPRLEALSSAVAVPCYYKHFRYLPGLLSALTQQTHLPDEVVISLSQVEQLAAEDIDAFEMGPWPFHVVIIRRTGVFMEGANRTTAARSCFSDVVLCIDADDIPHPQRIEAVLQLFEALPEVEMVFCAHAYCPGEAIICDPAIPFFEPEEFMLMRFELGPHTWMPVCSKQDLMRWELGLHNGSPSLRRSLIESGVYWSDLKNGADLEFNNTVLLRNHAAYFIQLPLLHYYNGRSSGSDVGRDK